jgi:hypothetical protein
MTTTTTIDQEIQQVEERYWKAMEQKDIRTLEELTVFPSIVTGAQGVHSLDRATFAKMLQDSSWRLEDARLSDIHVQEVTDDVAVVGYKVREKLIVEGKPLTLEAAELSTWVRRNGSWACVAHAEGILGDPWGRDRQSRA